jgi:hypothetical protein
MTIEDRGANQRLQDVVAESGPANGFEWMGE